MQVQGLGVATVGAMSSRPRSVQDRTSDPFGCPFCGVHAVERLYVASNGTDTCSCLACGSDWDEIRSTGHVLAPGSDSSVLAPRQT